jgi:hypothetical protein
MNTKPKEKMRLTIELADNGIILRNPECEDEVTLALQGNRIQNGYDINIDHSEEYMAIGKKIYDWLNGDVATKWRGLWAITGAKLDITATLTGHDPYEIRR